MNRGRPARNGKTAAGQAEFRIVWELTPHPFRLRAGDVIRLDNRLCRVIRVNECSAIVLVNRAARDFVTRFDRVVRFQPPPIRVRISPNAEVEIITARRR